MKEKILEILLSVIKMNDLTGLKVDLKLGLLVCIFLSMLFVHFILKVGMNYFSNKQFTILLTYLFNSLLILVTTIIFVYILDEFILLKIGLQLLLYYGILMTLLSLIFAFKSKKKSV